MGNANKRTTMRLPKTIKKCIRAKGLQPFWEFMLDVTMYGMNIGPASLPLYSGESYLLKNLPEFLGKKINDSLITVFDVGANIGKYALEVYAALGSRARIFCFEPAGFTYEILKENIRGIDTIALHNHGFSDKIEELELFFDMKGSGLASLYNRRLEHQGTHLQHREVVRLLTLDTFCRDNEINSINLLKVDVEGHEYKVFSGATEMFNLDAIDMIQFEFGGCNIDSRTYLQDFYYLLNPKYRLYRLVFDGLVPIANYNEKYELFRTTNFVAIHRKIKPVE
jgi:FkbM family methyltransferase